MHNKTPIALFTYNRPEHTAIAIEALSKSARLSECELFFYSDAPRNEVARSAVEATRQVVGDWAEKLGATVITRSENFGLAKSIYSGVTDLCERFGRVVVIEDDLVVAPDFVHFMIESLDRYEDNANVMQIGGLTLRPPANLQNDAFFIPVTTTWGWGTWKRSWQHFRWKPEDLDASKSDDEWRKLFDLNGTCTFSSMLQDRINGNNDSWGILWWYAVSRRRGLVLYPSRSLVWNGGFDGSGIHCGSEDFLQQGEIEGFMLPAFNSALSLPSASHYEASHLTSLEDFFRDLAPADGVTDPPKLGKRLKSLARRVRENFRHAVS